jgi:mRNA interferase HicA
MKTYMKGSEFLRAVKRLANERGIEMRFEAKRGKGSHGTLSFGTSRTILQNPKKELPSGTLHAMLRQLGLSESDLG